MDLPAVTVADIRQPSLASVLRELIERRVLPAGELVDRGVVAVDTSMSHRSFRLRVGDEERLFVKRVDSVGSQGRDLAAEAVVYRLAAGDRHLASVMPRCRVVSDDDKLIVLDDVGAPSVSPEFVAVQSAGSRPAAGPSVLDGYGRAVARIHQTRPPIFGEPPWFLTALDPRWGGYEWLPAACRDVLVRAASSQVLRQRFGRAASMWRASALIHGDLRWSNVLSTLDGQNPRVWLVDWELSCLGDPAWDIGSVIGDLVAVLLSAPNIAPGYEPLTAAGRFVTAYLQEARPRSTGELRSLIERSVAFAGIRLVQTLVEYGYAGRDEVSAVEPFLRSWIDVLLADPAALGRWLMPDVAPIGSGAA